MSEKIIDDFENMINEVCGDVVKLEKKKYYGKPTPDFYDLPFQHEDFMKWYKEKEEERTIFKMNAECSCGEKYVIYTSPPSLPFGWPEVSMFQEVTYERFFCYKCGKPFMVTGNKILKIKSEKLEVVL